MTETTPAEASPDQAPEDHCGIFTIPGPLAIQSAWRDITFEPVRDRIWTVSEGIYRTIFLEGETGVIAFDTFSTPGGARAYQGAIQRVFPHKPVHTVIYSHEQCPSSNKWDRCLVLLRECFAHHFHVTRRVVDSANDVSR